MHPGRGARVFTAADRDWGCSRVKCWAVVTWRLWSSSPGLAPRWGAGPSAAVFRWSFPLGPDDHRLPSANPPGWPPAASSEKCPNSSVRPVV